MPKAVIVDAVRTAIGRFGGGLLEFSAVDLGAHLISALVERNQILPEQVDEVIFGQVLQAGCGQNPARAIALQGGLPETVCAFTVNKTCGSGLKALDLARQAIVAGEGGLLVAGGTESMSNAPYYVTDMRWGHKLGSATMVDAIMDEGLTCHICGLGMGPATEELVTATGITRQEMDAWALRSQQRALAAIAQGRFAEEIVPIARRKAEPCAVDEHPRETSLEALAGLRPAFRPDGCITAGNASGINDGAAALIVCEADRASQLGRSPRATIVGSAWAGVEPRAMGLGPVPAVRKLCAKMGVAPGDFDLIELNEAFAVQALAVMRELGLDEEKVNVNGSGIALGHPIGATGARIVVTLLHEMEKRDLRLGLATLCIGGGMGMAMAIEREG